jgi:hypothetical protein
MRYLIQDKLTSGENIKTVNGASILGSGNLIVSGSGLADGDYGDVTVSGSGTVITIDNLAVTNAKINDVEAIKVTTSTSRRFVTDAQLTVIGNTSGTNTGDNAVNSLYSGLASSKQDTLVSATNIKTINGNTILGSGDMVISGGSITGVEASAGADVTMASTNTWYTGATVNLVAGTWLITAHITLNRTTTTAQQYQVRIQNTTDALSYASSQQYQASAANAVVSMSLTAIITIAGTKDVAIQGCSSVSTNNLIKAATVANGSGNNATKITAIKLS